MKTILWAYRSLEWPLCEWIKWMEKQVSCVLQSDEAAASLGELVREHNVFPCKNTESLEC